MEITKQLLSASNEEKKDRKKKKRKTWSFGFDSESQALLLVRSLFQVMSAASSSSASASSSKMALKRFNSNVCNDFSFLHSDAVAAERKEEGKEKVKEERKEDTKGTQGYSKKEETVMDKYCAIASHRLYIQYRLDMYAKDTYFNTSESCTW